MRKIAIIATLLCGCASIENPKTINHPDVAMSALKVFLNRDAQFSRASSFLDDTQLDRIRTGIMKEVATALNSAGYSVVATALAPHDVEIKVSGYCEPGLGDQCRVTFVVSGNGTQLDSTTLPCRMEDDTWKALARTFANKLTDSAALKEYAKLDRSRATVPVNASNDVPASAPRRPADDRPVVSGASQPNAFALVIGIETYRDVPPATGAKRDAESFSHVALNALGIPEANIIVALNDRASKSDIEKHLNWLKANVRKNDRIFFYFSGHGAPEPSTGTSYLLPYDGDPAALDQTALPLRVILDRLSQTSAREVLAIVDSCFSGAGGRSVLPAGARPLVRVNTEKASGKLALFTAASGSQISGPAHGESAGLFSHHLVTALSTGQADLDGDGTITLRELADWVTPRVERDARRDNRDQKPSLQVGETIRDADEFVVTVTTPAARR